jgi:hypothetical protein
MKLVLADFKLKVVGSPAPDEPAVEIIKGDTVVPHAERRVKPNGECYGGGTKGGEDVRLIAARLDDFPAEEATAGGWAARRLVTITVASSHGSFVGADDLVCGACAASLPLVDPNDALTEAANLIELMGDEDDGAAGAGNVAHLAKAFFLEINVADGEDLINEEDFRFKVSGNGKSKADVHAGGVVFDLRVDEFFELGKGDDFVELAFDFALAHTEDGAGEKRVLSAGELGMEAGSYFEKAADAAVDFRPPGGGARDAGENFQERGFASAVAADEAEDFTFADFQADVLERPEGLFAGAAEDGKRRAHESAERIAQEASLCVRAAMVAFSEVLAANCDAIGGHVHLNSPSLTVKRSESRDKAREKTGIVQRNRQEMADPEP